MTTQGSQNNKENLLEVTKTDQFRTVDELLKFSQPSILYYTLLTLAAGIVALGLLLDNGAIVIGGMLVAPVLTPILTLALGVAVGEADMIKQISVLMIKSFFLIVAVALIIAFILGAPQTFSIFENTVRTAILYFLVAFCSGLAATLAWVRKEVREVLPGIAIAVSLVPPLSLVGIWLSAFHLETVRFYLFVFLLNLFGVIVGSLIVFSLTKFYKLSARIEQKVEENKPPEKHNEK